MGEGAQSADGDRIGARRLHRRQLLGGGLLGATGAVLAPRAPGRGGPGEVPADPGRADVDGAEDADRMSGGVGAAPDRPGVPVALRVSGLAAPLGLGLDDVYFAWQLHDRRRGARQTTYRIVVSGPVTGPGPSPTVWDSGTVHSSEQAFVAYGGPPLSPDTAYRWTVQTSDASGESGATSAASTFETGLADHGWRAAWIRRVEDETAEPDQYTYTRREFTLDRGRIHRARAYVSGDQQYELYVNGIRAGKGQAYSYPDSMYYETLDLTDLLRPGVANAVGIVTNWQGPTKGHPAGAPGVIAEIVVHRSDGPTERVTTDGSWRVAKGAWLPGTERDLEGDLVDFTENIDGPAQPVGWDRTGFDDGAWAPAVVLGRAPTAPWTRLVPVRTRIVEEPVPAVSLTALSSGALVADFGKVYAAVPTVRFRQGVVGRLVTMRAGFLLDQPVAGQPFEGVPGQVSTAHGTQHTDMSYSYVQRGGDERFHPFDYLGFRYLQIDDPGEMLAPADVVALARHTALPDQPVATFSSSEAVIDAEFQLGAHSALYTAQEQYIDTPTREKGSWLFDGFNESRTAMSVFGEQNLTRKSLVEFGQSQARFWPNGAVNKIYPTGLGALDINESTEAYVEWVWQYWMHTGDRGLVESVYGVVERIADYVQRAVAPDTGLVTSLPSTNVYYDTPVVTRLNVLGVNVFRRAAALSRALGRPAGQAAVLQRRQAALTAAVNRRLTRPDGTYVDGLDGDGAPTPTASQTANACAVAYGVTPATTLGAVGRYVSSLGMQATPQNAGEVLRALALAGLYPDLVARLVDATSDGWANILARGATFTWEVWNPSDVIGDSMSHGWGATMVPEIQRSLLGVRPTGPGFSTFEVVPPPEGLDWALGTVPTPRGTVSVAWRRPTPADPRFSVDVEVPPNSAATLTVPADREGDITEGGRPIRVAAGVRLLARSGGTARLALGAGTYRVRSASTA
jgi:alpha-L-rhamnosidase